VLEGKPLDNLQAHQRARAGVRRTWQTTRISPQLEVGTYLDLAAGRKLDHAESVSILEWLSCPAGDVLIAGVDAGTRRLLDIAGTLAAKPKIILLDEPAAGLSHEESMQLAARIAEIPQRFGIAVLLVEHDMDLVRMVCNSVVVLDFGRIIAMGPTRETLASAAVIKAYVGDPEELTAT
jgi:branched-chain amino acid transport system permease protein